MGEMTNRRRFLAVAATAGIASVTGCIGGGEQSLGDEQSPGEDENGDDHESEPREDPEEFDFPPGANETGIVAETLVAGSRQFVDDQDRYRTTQIHDIEYGDGGSDSIEMTYDVDERLVHEREMRNGVEIDRWVTPDRVVAQSVGGDADRTNRWQSRNDGSAATSAGSFNRYPFEDSTVPSLVKSASFEFDEIVTESEQPYARYTGEIKRAESLELRQPKSARVDTQVESASDGNLSILLAESGAIRTVEYEFSGEGIRLAHDGRKEVGIQARGEVDFEYHGDLEPLQSPEWVESPDWNETRTFEISRTSLGETIKLVEGQPLPGSVEREYTKFYVTAQFGSEVYIDRFMPRMGFDTSDGLVAGFDEDEFQLDWAAFSGPDAFVEADRVEMSVYLFSPVYGRSLVYHEEYQP